jgi:hypothetical protein
VRDHVEVLLEERAAPEGEDASDHEHRRADDEAADQRGVDLLSDG